MKLESARGSARLAALPKLKDQVRSSAQKLEEQPNWFWGVEPKDSAAMSARTGSTSSLIGNELRPFVSAIGLFDQTSFAGFMLVGKDAGNSLVVWILHNDNTPRSQVPLIYTRCRPTRRHRMRSHGHSPRLLTPTTIVTGTGRDPRLSLDRSHIPESWTQRLIDR